MKIYSYAGMYVKVVRGSWKEVEIMCVQTH